MYPSIVHFGGIAEWFRPWVLSDLCRDSFRCVPFRPGLSFLSFSIYCLALAFEHYLQVYIVHSGLGQFGLGHFDAFGLILGWVVLDYFGLAPLDGFTFMFKE